MTDERMERDQGYLVIEDDMCLHKPEEPADEDAQQPGQSSASSAARGAEPAAAPRAIATGAPPSSSCGAVSKSGAEPAAASQRGTWYEKPPKFKKAEMPAPSSALDDIVSILTQAHRLGRGHIVWLSWNAGQPGVNAKKPAAMKFGGTMIFMSKLGAEKVLQAVQDGSIVPGHWDVVLKNWLKQPGVCAAVGASYLVPPMGNFTAHFSQVLTGNKFRFTNWGDHWVCPGTHHSEDPRERQKWLSDYSKLDGASNWIANVRTRPSPHPHNWLSYWDHDAPRPIAYAETGEWPLAGQHAAGAWDAAWDMNALPDDRLTQRQMRMRRAHRQGLAQFRTWTDDEARC